MIQQYLQSIPRRQIIIRHLIQPQLLEGPVHRHEKRVPSARDMWRQIGQIQKARNVREPFVPLEGEEGVREELRPEPGEREQWGCLFVAVLLVETRDNGLADEEHLADEEDVALGDGGVVLDDGGAIHQPRVFENWSEHINR